MKALRWTRYGGTEGLVYGDAPKPEPGPGQVRLRVRASALNAADLYLLQGKPWPMRFQTGLLKPQFTALGADVAGIVDRVGPGVEGFQPGDRVFTDLSGARWGGLAEYAVGPAKVFARLPASIPFEKAAAVPMAAVTAFLGLTKVAGVKPGDEVLVHGASGGVGTFAVQIARCLGARVTAVCSARHADLVRGLGADRVVDYQKEDFVGLGPVFQAVLAANGDRSLGDYAKVIVPGGTVAVSGGSMRQIFQALLLGPWLTKGNRKVRSVMGQPSADVLVQLAHWMEQGQLSPVVDKVFPLERGAEAFAWLKGGHSRGKVVVSVP